MPLLDPETLSAKQIYKLLIGSVEPRPIALVSTVSKTGTPNLAPFSFFTVASVSPPVLAVSTMLAPGSATEGGTSKTGAPKDTLTNLHETGECVIHIVSFDLRDKMNRTAAPWSPEVSEFEESGLTPVPSTHVTPFRVAESHVAFECRVQQIISLGDEPLSGNLVLARIVSIYVSDAALDEDRIDRDVLDPIGRLGGSSYVRVKDATFDLQRAVVEIPSKARG